ncbi:MAG: hypothetical protein U0990_09660 [Candidatus Nanopelagicales bacterium]|nr:hypothetical protein [Candidatus Nanopelagicales bacterium]
MNPKRRRARKAERKIRNKKKADRKAEERAERAFGPLRDEIKCLRENDAAGKEAADV